MLILRYKISKLIYNIRIATKKTNIIYFINAVLIISNKKRFIFVKVLIRTLFIYFLYLYFDFFFIYKFFAIRAIFRYLNNSAILIYRNTLFLIYPAIPINILRFFNINKNLNFIIIIKRFLIIKKPKKFT